MAHVLAPVRRRDLILNEGVDGFCIRDAQQRLGQTHQGDTFIG